MTPKCESFLFCILVFLVNFHETDIGTKEWISMGFSVRIAICDDEVIYRENLKTECKMFFAEYSHESLWPGVPEISEFSTGKELIMSDQDYDILFLDIEMLGQDGIRIKEYFAEYHEKTRIIFMTCHDERVMEAFGKNVVSFLVKPLNSKDFRKVLKKTLDDICGQVLELEENGEPLIIPVRQIKYIEAQDKYTMIVMENKRYLLRRTIKFWEETLPRQDFCRIHKSYLLNLDYFEKTGDQIVLDRDKTVKLSRKMKREILEQYREYLRRKVRVM